MGQQALDASDSTESSTNRAAMPPAPSTSDQSILSAASAKHGFGLILSHWALWLPSLGGALLVLHFWRIGYTPSLSLADIGTVLAAMLAFAAIGLVVFAGLLLLPVFFLSEWAEAGVMRGPPAPVPDHARPSDRARRARERRTARGKRPRNADHSVFRMDFSAGSMPSFVSAGVTSFAVYALLVVVAYESKLISVSTAVLAAFAPFAAIEMLLVMFANAACLRRRLRMLRRHRQQWLLLFVLYMGTWPMVLLPFLSMQASYLESRSFYFALALLLVPFLHWLWFVTLRANKPVLWLIKTSLIVMILLFTGLPKAATDVAMNTFGLGMLPHVNLVLTARGCDIAQAAWPQGACVPQRKQGVEAYRLENVEVLTRIGAHVYVGAPGAMNDESLPRFPIPSGEVLSWRRMPPPKAGAKQDKPTAPKPSLKPPSPASPSLSQPSQPAAASPPASNAPR